MKYSIEKNDKYAVVFISGSIEANASHATRLSLVEEISRLGIPVIVDASGISGTDRDVIFITGIINAMRREADYRNNRLLVGSLAPFISAYLSRTGVGEIFEIYESTEAAAASMIDGEGNGYRNIKTA